MLLTKEIEIILHPKHIKYYEELGYKIPKSLDKWGKIRVKKGTSIIIKIEDLQKGSNLKIKVLCDYCLENGIETIIDKTYCNYIHQNEKSIIHKDCCPSCKGKKTKESNLIIYGVESIQQLPETREKTEKTNMDKFGVKYSCQNEAIKEKKRKTNIERYGSECSLQNEDVKNKIKETNIIRYGSENPMSNDKVKNKRTNTVQEKYGVDCVLESPDVRNKIYTTNLDKYGCENPFGNEEIKEKIHDYWIDNYGVDNYAQTEECKEKTRNTCQERFGCNSSAQDPTTREKMIKSLYENSTASCSTQQFYLNELLNGELNFPVGACSLDIAFPKENIFCEYDGSGHDLSVRYNNYTQEEFNKKERNRTYFLKSKGWSEIRIISRKDYLPSDGTLLLMIEYAKEYINTGHSWITFDIDNNIIKCSRRIIKCDFGDLRKIKKAS